MKRIFFLLTILSTPFIGHAQLRLPGVFDDHMVIQQQSPVPIWGWSHPTQNVTINVSWDTTTYRATSDNRAFWQSTIYSPVAGGPHTITVTAGGEKKILSDVMSGEVWLCSGQSNMEWGMHAAEDGRAATENVNDPLIRLFHVAKSAAETPQVRGEGQWRVCDKEAVRYFSAVGYFFGKKLNQELNIPIGIMAVSWGGTPAEAWTRKEIIEANAELKAAAAKHTDDKPWCPSKPEIVYNSMIYPLIPFRFAGVLWYQGEANVDAPYTYKKLMEQLILDWRKQFQHDFPFYYVQIAPFSGYGDTEYGTLIREQQVKMLAIPKTGMVVISDHVDDVKDIHPKFKKPVGERLANLALGDHYGQKNISYRFPIYKSMKVEKGKVRISFENADAGLMSKNGEPTEFTIAGEDHKFYPAKVKIEGSTVVVSAKEVKNPVAVRFAWKNGSIGNLFNKEGLPVSSFRTDEWPIP
jgi:sialate O-acetylesterase